MGIFIEFNADEDDEYGVSPTELIRQVTELAEDCGYEAKLRAESEIIADYLNSKRED